MKKKVTIALIIVILFNTLIPNFIYADPVLGNIEDIMKYHSETGQESMESLFEEGEATVTPSNGKKRKENVGETNTISNYICSGLTAVLIVPAITINTIINLIIIITQDEENGDKFSNTDQFTIENLVLGKYTLFDINFFEDTNTENRGVIDRVRDRIATWYFVLRKIAIVGSLLVLIYIGIRMALSTISEEQAKYKKMLISWLKSFVLLFLMHYIVIFLVNIQEALMDILSGVAVGKGFEERIIQDTWSSLLEVTGWNNIWYLVSYYMLVYYQVKFFLMYFKRFLSVGFLIIISPLITVTYSIDEVGDGKAQAFKIWLKEMVFNIFIQIVHAVIYIVFIFSAAEIAKKIPMLGILFLMTLSRAEKIVKNTFALRGKGFGEEKPLNIIKGK